MKKLLKWVGIAFLAIFGLGVLINATKSPEQKAAESAQREKEATLAAEKERQEQAQEGIPKCDDERAIETLKNAFDQSQFARSLNLSAIEVTDIHERGFNTVNRSRDCVAAITMNNTKKVNVTVNIAGRDNHQFMLTFSVVGSLE